MGKIDLYKKNQSKQKWIGVLTPITFWVLIALSVICVILALKNSFGNIDEITRLLDNKAYNGEQLQENYNMLIDKYGEWVIGTGNNGFTLVFINIKNAIFSGFVVLNGVMSVVFLVSAFVLGKWVLPLLKERYATQNQDMVNLTILKDK